VFLTFTNLAYMDYPKPLIDSLNPSQLYRKSYRARGGLGVVSGMLVVQLIVVIHQVH